jgi:hypothetical protein
MRDVILFASAADVVPHVRDVGTQRRCDHVWLEAGACVGDSRSSAGLKRVQEGVLPPMNAPFGTKALGWRTFHIYANLFNDRLSRPVYAGTCDNSAVLHSRMSRFIITYHSSILSFTCQRLHIYASLFNDRLSRPVYAGTCDNSAVLHSRMSRFIVTYHSSILSFTCQRRKLRVGTKLTKHSSSLTQLSSGGL